MGAFDPTLGRELAIGLTYPDDSSCESPEVTAELEDAQGNRLPGITGNPAVVFSPGGSCSTNVGPKCAEQVYLYWSNWCDTSPGPYQIAAFAFGGRLRASALMGTPPPCSDPQAASTLASLHF